MDGTILYSRFKHELRSKEILQIEIYRKTFFQIQIHSNFPPFASI